MNTEMTDISAAQPTAGWICYDGECALCLRWLNRVKRPLLRRGFLFVSLQTEWVKARLNLADSDPLTEMRLICPNEEVLGGADAAVVLMRHVWWLRPLWLISRIPGAMTIFHAVYRLTATNRHCVTGACRAALKGGQP